MKGTCAFCERETVLLNSHVLPAFVYRWLRDRSGTGHIRHTENPNRRVQDGLKLPWLCNECESLFSKDETAFATHAFHRWHSGNHEIPYGQWLLRFCVSVSWRVLRFARGKNEKHQYSSTQNTLMDQADKRWRAFLRGEVNHPGDFEQHLLIFDLIESTTVPDLPNNFNRFMSGAVTLDIIGSEKSLMTFAKLGNFIVFGSIQKGSHHWEGTKVRVRHGLLKPGDFAIPSALLSLFKEKAVIAHKAMLSVSPAQIEKIDRTILTNMDHFAKSEQFKSILADADLFGEDAVVRE